MCESKRRPDQATIRDGPCPVQYGHTPLEGSRLPSQCRPDSNGFHSRSVRVCLVFVPLYSFIVYRPFFLRTLNFEQWYWYRYDSPRRKERQVFINPIVTFRPPASPRSVPAAAASPDPRQTRGSIAT